MKDGENGILPASQMRKNLNVLVKGLPETGTHCKAQSSPGHSLGDRIVRDPNAPRAAWFNFNNFIPELRVAPKAIGADKHVLLEVLKLWNAMRLDIRLIAPEAGRHRPHRLDLIAG